MAQRWYHLPSNTHRLDSVTNTFAKFQKTPPTASQRSQMKEESPKRFIEYLLGRLQKNKNKKKIRCKIFLFVFGLGPSEKSPEKKADPTTGQIVSDFPGAQLC